MAFKPYCETCQTWHSKTEGHIRGECYCDFEARKFFGCDSEEHVPPCPQAVPVSSHVRGGDNG